MRRIKLIFTQVGFVTVSVDRARKVSSWETKQKVLIRVSRKCAELLQVQRITRLYR
jgi:hypothetical protein